MANQYTASFIVGALRRYGYLPAAGSGSLTTADYVALINDEAQLYLTSLIKSVREDHLEVTSTVTVVAGTGSYQVPSRAVANSLTMVSLVNSNGDTVPMPQLYGAHTASFGQTGTPAGFELLGTAIVLHPTPTAGGTLKLRYLQRLSRVVTEDAVGLITAINTGTNQVTISAAPSAFLSGLAYDLVRGTPGFDNLAIDQTATISGTVLTFSALPVGLAIGDYVALAGETPIPQVPPDLFPLLTTRVALRVGQSTASPNMPALTAEVETLRHAALELLTPRVGNAVRPIINYNGPGWGRWRR